MGVVRRYWQQQVPAPSPFRVMAVGVLVTTAGEGAWYTSWAIYFTTVAGLSAASVGLGLMLAGGAGLLTATPIGAWADRVGPRNLLIALIAVDGASMAAFTTVRHSYGLFLAIAVMNTITDRASVGVKTTYVAELAAEQTRVAELARQRVASHLGYTGGAALGAVCLSLHTPAAFTALIILNAATSLAYAGLLARVPVVRTADANRIGRQNRPRRQAVTVFTDPAFLAVVSASGLLSLCWGLVSTALPLWLVRDTGLPAALAGLVVVINSIGIAGLQVLASRGCDTPRAASRRALWSGTALGAACLLIAVTRGAGGALAAGVIVLAAGAHLAGELWFIAAKWGLTLALTPPGATGRYQALAATAQAAAQMISPVVMTLLIGGWGQPGWLVLAATFLAAGAATIPATRWAVHTRPRSALLGTAR